MKVPLFKFVEHFADLNIDILRASIFPPQFVANGRFVAILPHAGNPLFMCSPLISWCPEPFGAVVVVSMPRNDFQSGDRVQDREQAILEGCTLRRANVGCVFFSDPEWMQTKGVCQPALHVATC